MQDLNSLNYFALESTNGHVFSLIERDKLILTNGEVNSDNMRKYTEALFGKTIEEILKGRNDYYMSGGCYVIPISIYLYRLKESDCPYELIGVTGEGLKQFTWHCLKKKQTNNID